MCVRYSRPLSQLLYYIAFQWDFLAVCIIFLCLYSLHILKIFFHIFRNPSEFCQALHLYTFNFLHAVFLHDVADHGPPNLALHYSLSYLPD